MREAVGAGGSLADFEWALPEPIDFLIRIKLGLNRLAVEGG